MKITTQEKESVEVMPILAAAALHGAGASDDQVKSLLVELLQGQVDKRKKDKERAERYALNAVQAAEEEQKFRHSEQAKCNHLKQDNSTRLSGQRLSGTGQVSLVCKFCHKNYYWPPILELGQEAPPRHLIPPGDEIGG